MRRKQPVLIVGIVFTAAMVCWGQTAGNSARTSGPSDPTTESSASATTQAATSDNKPPSGAQPVGLGIGGEQYAQHQLEREPSVGLGSSRRSEFPEQLATRDILWRNAAIGLRYGQEPDSFELQRKCDCLPKRESWVAVISRFWFFSGPEDRPMDSDCGRHAQLHPKLSIWGIWLRVGACWSNVDQHACRESSIRTKSVGADAVRGELFQHRGGTS